MRKAEFFHGSIFFCQDGSNEESHAPGSVHEVCFHPQAGQGGIQRGRRDITKIYTYMDTQL